MTRAALLHLLDSPAALSVAAVRDLELLTQAFPYCQTAHLLLAKAAHDQGSMLAGQRLRRAATYATDRQLLRQLLEQQPPAPASSQPDGQADSALEEAPGLVAEAAPAASAAVLTTPIVAVTLAPEEGVGKGAIEQPEVAIAAQSVPAATPTEDGTEVAEALSPARAPEPEPRNQPEKEDAPAPLVPTEALPAKATAPVESSAEQTVPAQEPAAEAAQPAPVLAEVPALSEELLAEEIEEITEEVITEEVPIVALLTAGEADPASPPPIRPPAEAGTARFEFGLSTPALEAEFAAYQLPELPAEEAPATRPAAPGPAAFRGADGLGYALGGGSRLGYAMQAAAPAEAAMDTPGSTLPAAGEFFAPDALLLEHLARQPPPAPLPPSSLDLIDSFLRRAPQRRRGIVTLLTVPEQADLSMRSTRAEPDLASESLARILAGQGKTERAIAVYERLMVRQPEKSAYFAVQIDLLRNPPTPTS